ncbi:MAG: glycine oxidase ThiO [Planctomycetales bacterium]
MADVVVVGGGVIGLSIAWELAGAGASVRLLDQSGFGQEASWAGAGILPPGNPRRARAPLDRLRAESAARWPALAAQLAEETGIDNGFRAYGGLTAQFGTGPSEHRAAIDEWRDEDVSLEELSPAQLAQLEPELTPAIEAAFLLPGAAQVRNPRHLKALVAACAGRGVELLPGEAVVGFESHGERIEAVRSTTGLHRAGRFCVASGAWSRRLLAETGLDLPIEPVRGQIVLLSLPRPPFRRVVQAGHRYLVPRPDGRVLVGSTMERVGFDKRTTAEGVAGLIEFAVGLVPALANATVERTWAGLRPGSPDNVPFLGRVPGHVNLFVAAGHFRAGLQMSPATAVLLRQAMLDQDLLMPLEPFACDRRISEVPMTKPQ